MSHIPTLTYILLQEWFLLFEDEKLVNQGDEDYIMEVLLEYEGKPIIIKRLLGYDTQLDAEITESGCEAPVTLTLTEAKKLLGKGWMS
jgi:hypothetical protein